MYHGKEGINRGKKRRARRQGISERREEDSRAIACAASIENSQFRLSSEEQRTPRGGCPQEKTPKGFL